MVILINPNYVVSRRDLFTTGVVYMPFGLAYFAANLKAEGLEVQVVDAFADSPGFFREHGDFFVFGLTPAQVVSRIPSAARAAVLYAINMTAHVSLIEIAKEVKAKRPDIALVVLENAQAVTAYSLAKIQEDFYACGVDYILTGNPRKSGPDLMRALTRGEKQVSLPGVGFKREGQICFQPASVSEGEEAERWPSPAWELFPLDNYWRLKFGHGPFQTEKYLPILTSRGCPYGCAFCVTPATNRRQWQGRPADEVVDEMEYCLGKFGVREFHFEDVNPTVSDERVRAICREIIKRKLAVIWKLVSGTKIETIKDEETIRLMARAGCNYISFSPESGSPEVLKSIEKPFDRAHAFRLLKAMRENGIKSQACFVIGFPGETDADRRMSADLVRKLTRAGVDEIAVFMITPVPGSALFEKNEHRVDNYSQLNFSPTWRPDYEKLNRFRLHLYRNFILWKLMCHPTTLLKQPFHFLFRTFYTKMEMVPYRVLKIKQLIRKGARHAAI